MSFQKNHKVPKEWREKISKRHKGIRLSQERKAKMKFYPKGHIPWNKGKKGLQKSIYKGKKVPWLIKYQFRSGFHHPNWKGAKSRNKHTISSPEYKKWRNDVYKRDNWTCHFCNKRGNKLEAHHKKSWSEFPELRYIIDNGITLCEECHFGLTHLKIINCN